MERLGQHVLLEKVAIAGMAELFKAKKIGIEGFEQILAVKKILPSPFIRQGIYKYVHR